MPLDEAAIEWLDETIAGRRSAGYRFQYDGEWHGNSMFINEDPWAVIDCRQPLKELLLVNARQVYEKLKKGKK